jgi:hypothetical protein
MIGAWASDQVYLGSALRTDTQEDVVRTFQLTPRFAGPRSMGHGGYVSGLLAEHLLGANAVGAGAVQVTLRRPTPFDLPLTLQGNGGSGVKLMCGDELLSEAERSELELTQPALPSIDASRAAESGSPSHYGGQGVHPSCFGCSSLRDEGDALRIFAGPCEVSGQRLVAATWSPRDPFVDPEGCVPTRYVLSALDCPGGFAFIAEGKRAGLLGRITFEQYRPVRAKIVHRVVGWQIGEDGKKMLAGTALIDPSGDLCAAAQATWFGMPGR